jgi:hypothetical protein
MAQTSTFDTQPKLGIPTWVAWHSISLVLILLALFFLELLLPSSLRMEMWLSVLALLGLFALIVGHGVTGLWLGFLIDTRNKVSLSRLQMLAWTILILSGFLAAVMVNIDNHQSDPLSIAIPSELWVLMGISTASLVGSPLIMAVKKNRPTNEAEKERALEQLAQRGEDPTQMTVRGQIILNECPICSTGRYVQGHGDGQCRATGFGEAPDVFLHACAALCLCCGSWRALWTKQPENHQSAGAGCGNAHTARDLPRWLSRQ